MNDVVWWLFGLWLQYKLSQFAEQKDSLPGETVYGYLTSDTNWMFLIFGGLKHAKSHNFCSFKEMDILNFMETLWKSNGAEEPIPYKL